MSFCLLSTLKVMQKERTFFVVWFNIWKNAMIVFEILLQWLLNSAPAMVDRCREFATLLKAKVPRVYAVHCVLHNNIIIIYLLQTHGTCHGHNQAHNQLGTSGGRRVVWQGPKVFKVCPIVLNYVLDIFSGGTNIFLGEFAPLRSPSYGPGHNKTTKEHKK